MKLNFLISQTWNFFESDVHLNLVDKTLDPSEYANDDVKKTIEIALMRDSPVNTKPKYIAH